jgi:hypothetical protein
MSAEFESEIFEVNNRGFSGIVFCVLTPCRGFGATCYIQRRVAPRRRQPETVGTDRLADPGVGGKLDCDNLLNPTGCFMYGQVQHPKFCTLITFMCLVWL